MQYISTRGEAPALGFIDVTLAGLARDGGLYVPQAWPALDAARIAAFAGRPYAEVACEVIAPFTAGAIAPADLARMAREAYDTFRHPAVVPLVQLAPNTFVLELFHGPTLAFKDLAMQLLVAPDGLRAGAAGHAHHHRGRDLGRHRRRRGRGVSRPRAESTSSSCFRAAGCRRCSSA